MSEILGGGTAKKQLRQTAEIQAANQRRSLAQMALEQGQLDQSAVSSGFRRGRGRQLLTFLEANGQASIG